MGFPQRLLGEDENVILHMRTHLKALIVPVIVLLAVAAAVGFGLGALPDDGTGATVVRWALVVAGVAVVARFSLWPFLVWVSTTYTVTSERLITRQGVITRYGRDIPLGRINDVAYNQDLVDRMLRCGSLNVSAASEQGTIVLRDVPRVHAVQLEMSELVREAHGWTASGRPAEVQPGPGDGDVTRPAGPDAGDATGRRTRPLASDEPYDWRRDADLGDPREP